MADTILTRAQLHTLVWEKPLRAAASELGISDVGLAKICKRHGVPTPPQGHWTRVHLGKAVTKGELPPAQPGHMDQIQIARGQTHAEPEAAKHPTMPPEEQARRRELLDRETQLEASVVVRQDSTKLHTLAARVQKALKAVNPDDYGCVRCSDPALPNVRVTPGGVPRAVALVDALARGAEARRYVWKSGVGHRWSSGASLVVEGVEFPIEIYESVERRPHELTAEERAKKARGQYYWARTYDYFGTDRFSLRRGEWDQYLKDTKHQKIEERLNDFFANIIDRAFESRERDRQRKIEEERQARRVAWRAEIKRLQGIEKASLERLHVHVSDLRKAQDLRSLIEEVSALDLPPDERRTRWLTWARAYADGIDPLRRGLERILDVDFEAFEKLRQMLADGEPD